MSWIDKVHEAHDESPRWLLNVLEHERFLQLDRVDGWRVVTTEEVEFRAASLRDVCRQFEDHYVVR
jgi:hypothetical protein